MSLPVDNSPPAASPEPLLFQMLRLGGPLQIVLEHQMLHARVDALWAGMEQGEPVRRHELEAQKEGLNELMHLLDPPLDQEMVAGLELAAPERRPQLMAALSSPEFCSQVREITRRIANLRSQVIDVDFRLAGLRQELRLTDNKLFQINIKLLLLRPERQF